MAGTVVYSVSHADGTFYVETRREAVAVVRECRRAGDVNAYAQRITVTTRLRRRALYCALLNNEGFASGHEDVA